MMRRGACLLILGACAMAAQADVTDEARAVGTAATTAIVGNLSTQPARDMTPGYTANPPQTSVNVSNMNASTATLLTLCQANASDPTCEGILKARSDAAVKNATPALTNDPAVQDALNNTKGTVIGGIAAGYSSCGTTTTTTGKQYYTTQSCFNYYQRSPDLSCLKNLQVSISWSCNAGASGPNFNGSSHYCDRVYSGLSCVTTTTTDSKGVSKTVTTCTPYSYVVSEAAIPTVSQWWDSGCSGYEGRVPSGMLPPDGQNPESSPLVSTGSVNKCMRSNSVCSDSSPTTRVIDTVPVTNACWQYTNTFDCVDTNPQSDCDQPRWGDCSAVSSMMCIEHDPLDPSICTAQRQDFSCMTADTRQTQTSANCAGQVYTDDSGVKWDTSHAPNTDLPKAVAFMEAGREAGMYMSGSPTNLELFKGFDNRCVKKLFGLVNCCNKTGGLNMSAFSNFSIIMGVGKTVGKAAASTYTYDALYASDAPNWMVQGFESLFDQGYQSLLADFAAGNLALTDLMVSMVPGPWTIAMMAVQYSGLTSCPQNQQITSIKRGANLCVDLGDYCSREFKALFFKVCVERTQSACCFNSKLAKAINVQGKAQLGRSMGWAAAPNCSGFTPDDFQKLDLSKMDFSEFMDDIKAQAVDTAATAARANPANCYYGAGKCN